MVCADHQPLHSLDSTVLDRKCVKVFELRDHVDPHLFCLVLLDVENLVDGLCQVVALVLLPKLACSHLGEVKYIID